MELDTRNPYGAPLRSRSEPTNVLFVGRADTRAEGLARDLAERAEFDVSFVADVDRAVDRVDDVECVVSASTLASCDGVDLLEAVRATHPDLPFILLASEGSESLASRAITADVTDYLELADDAVRLLERRVANAIAKYRTEQRMREAHLALETAREGISILDENDEFTYVNEVYADIYGYDPEEMVGMHWADLYLPEDAEAVREEILPQVREEGFWAGETTGERADGSTFPEMHSLAATEDGGLVCVVRDITDRKRREQELRERERYLRELHEITASAAGFESSLEQILELGRDRFGLDLGVFARIQETADGSLLTVEHAVGDHDVLQPGETVSSDRTFCERAYYGETAVDVPDAESAHVGDSPTYDRFGLQSYLGTAVSVGGERYGTLCFASSDPRNRPFTDDERTFLELMGEWLSSELERERRERRLAALNDVTQRMMDAEAAAAVSERLVAAAPERLDLPRMAVALYDREQGDLEVTARSSAAFPAETLCAVDGPGWEAFVGSEERVVTSAASLDAAELVATPLGTHGVLLTATDAADGFADADREFVGTIASNLTAALDRAERERLLHEREQTLEEQNEALERLNRVNDIIRNIDQGLVSASSREELDAVVCRHLGKQGPYELAWIGDRDPATGDVVPREWHGNEKGYLDAINIPEGSGFASAALAQGEPRVVDDVLTDDAFDPWRQEALARGYRSAIALPISYGGSVYGVLCIYASAPNQFTGVEQAVLTELSETIGHAINALESKKGLVDDRVAELEFGLGDHADVVQFAHELGADVTLESIVASTDDSLRAFVTLRGTTPDAVREAIPRPSLADCSLVAERETEGGPECLFEVALTDLSIAARTLDHGGVVQELSVTDGTGTARIWLPVSADTREFTEMLSRQHPGLDLVAKRERERTSQTRGEFRATLEGSLTDRQLEVLQTAYFSGFFESPRERTGTEVADSLGVSQPTFNRHIRSAQRKLLELVFDRQHAMPASG